METAVPLTHRFALELSRRWRALCHREGAPAGWSFHHECVLGTSLELQVRARSAAAARTAEQRVLDEIERLERVFSSFSPTSELRRWEATSGVPVALSPELLHVLAASDLWQARTGGTFQPAVEELTRLWKRCAEAQREPASAELEATLARMHRPQWQLDPAFGTAVRAAGCAVTLNAIAKGYIVDRSCGAAAAVPGVEHALVNVGGDLRLTGPEARIVGIADPRCDAENAAPLSRVRITDGAVATSGGYRRGLRVGGTWHSHLFDPRTGRPIAHLQSASVVAANALEADVLATAFSVLQPDESLALADSLPLVGCLLVTSDGSLHRSRRWVELEMR